MKWPLLVAAALIAALHIQPAAGQASQNFMPQNLRPIKVGAIFPDDDRRAVKEALFAHAIEMINSDKSVLLRARLFEQMESVKATNSIKASRKVCGMIENGLAALFGPSESPALASHVQSMAKFFHIPHLETRWNYNFERSDFSLNVRPHPAMVGKAYVDFIRSVGWKSFVIVYQDEKSLVKLQELLSMPKNFDDVKITLRQLYPDTDDQRPLFKEIKRSGETRIVLDCEFEYIEDLLRQADEVGKHWLLADDRNR